MMENRLGLLFGQIADSIRSGLGDTGTLRPNAFPAKIDDIVARIGTGGISGGEGTGSVGPLRFASGSFPLIEDGQRVTIEHGLGVMPDLIIVQVSNYLNFSTYEEAAQMQAMMAAWGMRSTFGTGNHSGYTSTVWGLNTTYGIDNMPEKEQTYGYIFCPDEATFQVGSTIAVGKLYSKTGYRWLAVSGIGGMVSNPVIEPLNVTENGTYEVPAGVDGFAPVTVSVDPGWTTLFRQQQVEGFVFDSEFNAYTSGNLVPAPFVLEAGKTYRVKWDEEVRECTAYAFTNYYNFVAIGNGKNLGFEDTGEKFLILHNTTVDSCHLFSQEALQSHTVGIWQKLVKEPSLQDKTVTQNGEVTADAGFDGLGKVLVALAASGGTVVAKKGTFRGKGSGGITVSHNLGVVPSVIYCYPTQGLGAMPNGGIGFAVGMSQAVASALAITENMQYGLTWNSYGSGTWAQTLPDYPIETTSNALLHHATETAITVGYSSYFPKDDNYTWYAIGIRKD